MLQTMHFPSARASPWFLRKKSSTDALPCLITLSDYECVRGDLHLKAVYRFLQ